MSHKRLTRRFPGKGDDGNTYTVEVTGIAELLGYDNSGKPEYGYTRPLESFSVDGYSGEIQYRSQGKFYLVDTGVEVTLDVPQWVP